MTYTLKNDMRREVKNLGWLLRKWQSVDRLVFNYAPEKMIDGELVAYLKDGTEYHSDYASLSVFWNWVNRPVFKGLPLFLWNAHQEVSSSFTIGDEQFVQINQMPYSKQMKLLVA